MKKSEWSDKQLIELLRQMPRVQDHRNPRDIYQNLSLKKRKKYPIWIGPSIAAAAAFLIVLILVPKVINSPQISYDQSRQEKISSDKMADSASNQDSAAMKKQNSVKKQYSAVSQPKLFTTSSLKTAIYSEDVGDGTVLTYWIPDPQAKVLIPVSTIVHEDKQKSWLTMFKEKMTLLKENEWGLSEYYPLNAALDIDPIDNSATVDVSSSNPYIQGSSSESMFLEVLKKDIGTNSNIKRIKLFTNSKAGIEFSNYGKMETLDINLEKNHAYFFYNPNNSDTPFLVPSITTYKDILSALSAMEQNDATGSGLKAPIPSNYIKEKSIQGHTLIVTINPKAIFKNDSNTLHSFEAILLAAKDCGIQKVMVQNSPISHLGPFDLTKEVEVPIAPNYRQLQ